jgi:CRISPR-associated protein Csx10
MKTYIVTATVVDEICIAERHGAGNEYLSLDHIPGTVWWGAIASLTGIKRGETPPEQFRRVFYSNEVIFTNLYPVERAVRAHPVPLSARTQKSAPGFRYNDMEPLFRDFAQDSQIQMRYPDGVKDWLLSGIPPQYQPDSEPMSGWYAGDPPDCKSVSVKMVLRGHNDRAWRSGTTREGRLFARQNIARGQKFQGALRALTQEGEQALTQLVKNCLDNGSCEIPIGRQPGCLWIELEDRGGTPPYWQQHDLQIDGEDSSILTVTLLSDALLLDHWLRPLPLLSAEDVASALNLNSNSVELLYHFSALREVSGWNSAHSRPRETELAVAAGSAFCYLVNWPPKMSVDKRRSCLSAWQQRGVGLRTAEGFGEIRINDPFHREFGGCGNNANN